MQTNIVQELLKTPDGREADSILRACTHCGFCTATCPTYQLLGDERDGPRGRIYLIKQVLEGATPTQRTQVHLDRCLTCQACETTCPSGVQYARLLDIGRQQVDEQVGRDGRARRWRWGLRKVAAHPRRFALALSLARRFHAFLPAHLETKIPPKQQPLAWPSTDRCRRTMLVLDGCVQPATAPRTNAAAARVLARLGIRLTNVRRAGCCGALDYHHGAQREGLDLMRRNIDAWWPHIEAGAEAIVMTASGCGAMVREYAHLLRGDPEYGEKAARVSALCRDLSEILADEDRSALADTGRGRRIAFHAPCTLQHGQGIHNLAQQILTEAGYELTPVADAHLCCGSAGAYSLLQPELSQSLLKNKLNNLESGEPELIATANIGCQLHLQTRASVPLHHWIELLDSPDAD
jgi:glycolate oxidase iron-sulfur subunit